MHTFGRPIGNTSSYKRLIIIKKKYVPIYIFILTYNARTIEEQV